MNVENAMEADIAQGRKYGCTRKNCRRPNVSGHRVAGLEKTPPIRGLEVNDLIISYELGKLPLAVKDRLRNC
jgi:hypothetical protein